MADPQSQHSMVWTGANYPRPDYLSSSRKRLAPQLIYKGGILHQWRKKIAVAVDEHFFATLPSLPEIRPEEADIAWLVYALKLDEEHKRYQLVRERIVYTPFAQSLASITTSEAGPVDDFIGHLQQKLDEKLESGYSPDAPTLTDILEG